MGSMDFWTNVNMHLNDIENVVIENFDTLPTAGHAGRIVYNDSSLWVDTGSSWVQLSGATALEALTTRVTAIEGYSSAYTSGIDSTKVAQIATNASNISTNTSNISANTTAISGLTTRVGTAESNISALQTGKVNTLPTAPSGTTGLKTTIDSQGLVTSVTTATTTDLSDWSTVRAGIQDKLTFDTVPTAGSSNPVTSGGIQAAIATAISSAYKVKGSKTVAEINALTDMVEGDVYNVTTPGTITAGGISVVAGDNIVYVTTPSAGWDKLAGTVDLSGYVQAGVTINTVALPATGGITLTPADIGALAADGTAVKATADASGNNIESTYATKDAVNGKMNKLGAAPSAGMIITSTATDSSVQASSVSLSDVTTAIADETTNGSIKKFVADGYVAKDGAKQLSTEDYTTAEKTKLAGVEEGAQANIIESVKVNGTALSITDKAVNVVVPTKTSDLENDGKSAGAFISSSEAQALINSAIASYFTKTQVAAFFDETAFTISEGSATVNVANVWMAQVMDATTNEIVYAEVFIGTDSVTINANGTPDGGYKLRYIVKPSVS